MNKLQKAGLGILGAVYLICLYKIYMFSPTISVDEKFVFKALVVFILVTLSIAITVLDYILLKREVSWFPRKIVFWLNRGLGLLFLFIVIVRPDFVSGALALFGLLQLTHNSATFFSLMEKIGELLELKTREFSALAFGNLIVFLVLLGMVEGGARLVDYSGILKQNQHPRLWVPDAWFRFQPWLMWVADTNLDEEFPLFNSYTKKFTPAHITTNNLGFRMKIDLYPGMPLKREANDRIVIFTGGSAAAGVGATSNAKTVSDRLEVLLNEANTGRRYRVFNFAQGAWVAYQSFLAIDLYAREWNPDWIINMDGRNDGWTACISKEGAFNPNFTQGFRRVIDGNLYKGRKPDFFRSETENSILKYSALYRLTSGKDPVVVPKDEQIRWDCVDKSLAFYIHALKSIRNVCRGKCKQLVSTQPLVDFYSTPSEECASEEWCGNRMTPEELEAVARKNEGKLMKVVPYYDFVSYFYTKLIDRSAEFARKENVLYQDMGALLPESMAERKTRDFIDHCHLTNAGHEGLARFYRDFILSHGG